MTALSKLVALAALVGTAASAPVAARWHDHDGGGRVAAGIAGVAIGAGLAASVHADRDAWYRDHNRDLAYDDGYYRTRGYYPADGYYASRFGDDYAGCRVEDRYDSYSGQRIRLRSCY